MASVVEELRGLALSATELKSMSGWPDRLVEDYLSIIDSLIIIAEALDAVVATNHNNLNNINGGSALLNQYFHLIETAYDFLKAQDQSVYIASEVEHTELTLSGTTALRLASTDATKKIVSVADLTAWFTDSNLQVLNDAGGGIASFNDDNLEFYIQAVA